MTKQMRADNKRRRPQHGMSRQANKLRENWMDVWLPRMSHFSQFGLFALTIAALYYTVIPLYQKAVLDEAIAKKELKLAANEKELVESKNRIDQSEKLLSESRARLEQSEKALDDSYAAIKRYVVNGFIFTTGAECTGLMSPIDPNSEKTEPEISPILTENYLACFNRIIGSSTRLNQLRKADRDRLIQETREAGLTIEAQRKMFIQLYRGFPAKAAQDPSVLKSLDGFSARYLKVMRPILTEQQYQHHVFAAGVAQGQRDIEREFRNFVQLQLQGLATVRGLREFGMK